MPVLHIAVDTSTMKAAIVDATQGMRQMEAQAARVSKSQEQIARQARAAAVEVAKLVGAYQAVSAAMDFVKRGVEYNASLEQSRIGIASLITSMAKLTDSQGKALQGMEKYQAAQGVAADLMKEIQKLGLQTTATTKELVDGVQSIMGPAMQAGMALKDIPKFAVAGAQAMQTLGVPLNQMRTELDALLTGVVNKTQDVLAPKLFADIKGDIGEYVKKLKESGELVPEIMRRLEPFMLAGQDIAQTWTGLCSNLSEAMDTIAGQAGQGLTESLKSAITVISDGLITTKNGTVGISENFENIARVLKDVESALGRGIEAAARGFMDALAGINSALKDVDVPAVMAQIESAVKGAIAALATYKIYTAATSISLAELAAAFGKVKAALQSLTLGTGAVGVALAAVAGAVTYFATQESASEQATKRYADELKRLPDALGDTAKAAKDAADQLKGLSETQLRLKADKIEEDAKALKEEIEGVFAEINGAAMGNARALGEVSVGFSKVAEEAHEVMKAFSSGLYTLDETKRKLDELAHKPGISPETIVRLQKLADLLEANQIAARDVEWALNDLAGSAGGAADSTSDLAVVVEKASKAMQDMEAAWKAITKLNATPSIENQIKSLDDLAKQTNYAKEKANELRDATVQQGLAMLETAMATAEAAGDYEKYYDLWTTYFKYTEMFNSGFADVTKANEKSAKNHAKAVSDLADKTEQAASSVRKLQAQLEADIDDPFGAEEARILAEYAERLKEINKELEKYAKDGVASAKVAELKTQLELEASLKRDLDLRKAQQTEQERLRQVADKQLAFYKELEQATGKYGAALQLEKKLLNEQAESLRKLQIPESYIEQWRRIQELQQSHEAFDGWTRGVLEFTAQYGDEAKQWEAISKDFCSGFDGAMRDMFDNFIDKGEVTFDSFKNLFKKMLKDIAYQALIQPITLQLTGSISNAIGGALFGSSGGATGIQGMTAAPASGASLTQLGTGLVQQYATSQLMSSFTGSGGGILGSIGLGLKEGALNVASWFGSDAATLALSTSAAQSSIAAELAAEGATELAAQSMAASNAAISEGFSSITSAIAPYATAFGLGSLGYSTIGDWVGLPQSEWSGLSAGVGALGGFAAGSALASSAALAGSAMAAGASFGSVIPVAGTIVGAILGGLAGSLFGGGSNTHASVYSFMDMKGLTNSEESLRANFWQGVDYDRAGSSEANMFIDPIINGVMRYQALYTELIDALPDEDLTANIKEAVEGERWWHWDNLQWWEEGMAEERLEGAIKGLGQSMGEATQRAFDQFDYSAYFTELDLTNEEGVNRAMSGVMAMKGLMEAVELIEEPAKEVPAAVSAAKEAAYAAVAQFDAITDAVANFGVNASWADEYVDRLQSAYVESWVNSIEDMLAPMSEFEVAFQNATDIMDGYVEAARILGATEEECARIESMRNDVLSQTITELMRSLEQNLSLRALALEYGSDSAEYGRQSLLYNQENELLDAAAKYGEDSSAYSAIQMIQAAERTKYEIDLLQKQLEQEQARESQAASQRSQAASQARQAQLNAEKKALQDQLREAERLRDAFERLRKKIEETRESLWASDDNPNDTGFAVLAAQFEETYQRAMQGDQEALEELPTLGTALITQGKDSLANQAEFSDLFYDVDKKLKDAQRLAEKEYNQQAALAASLEGKIAALDATVSVYGSASVSATYSVGGAVSSGSSAIAAQIAALQATLAGQMAAIKAAGATSVIDNAKAENGVAPLSDHSGIYGSNYRTESQLLASKVRSLNKDGYLGRTDWTAESAKNAMIADHGSVAEWYRKYGRAEGFASGGLASGWALVGEEGPELVNFTQPSRVYSHDDSLDLLGTGGMDDLRRDVQELNNALRQIAVNTANTAAYSQRSKDILRQFAIDGMAIAQ